MNFKNNKIKTYIPEIKYNIGVLIKYINLKNYEIQKVISDQLRTLAWAAAGIYTYLGIFHNKIIAILIVFLVWFLCMSSSLIILTLAEKQKIDREKK